MTGPVPRDGADAARPEGHVIGLDVGGTGARGLLADATGAVLAQARRERGGPPADGAERGGGAAAGEAGAVDLLVRLIGELRDAAGVRRVDAVVLGSTGVSGLGGAPRETLPALLGRAAGAAAVLFVSDALSSFVGALGLRAGAVVAAGTGAVAVGTDGRGAWRKADGWGHLLGDDGSGAWIGRAGLAAALRHRDGRPGGSAALLAALTRRFGGPAELVARLYTRPDRASLLARFVPDVAAAAAEGDPVAGGILDRAGALLAETAVAALPPAAPRAVSYAGNLIPSVPRLHEAFSRRLAESGVTETAPAGTAAEGAVRLATALRRGALPPGLPDSGLVLGEWHDEPDSGR